MTRPAGDRRAAVNVPARIRPVLGVLWEAYRYAGETSGDCWEFAVEINELTALGVTPNDLRWLVRQGLVEHQREVTVEGDDGRDFRPTGDLTFPPGTCFVLTARSLSAAAEVCGAINSNRRLSDPAETANTAACHGDEPVMSASGTTRDQTVSGHKPIVPEWDIARRELRLAGLTVKRFKWPAVNQEAILAAFEEEGWPARIDDPLPPHAEQDSKRRLSDTVKCLNRNQQHHLLHFRGDGTGEGVIWEWVDPTASGPGALPHGRLADGGEALRPRDF